MHMSTVTLSLALFLACVGRNNASADPNDHITPRCCVDNGFSLDCSTKNAPQLWFSAGVDCTRNFISTVACKGKDAAGLLEHQDGTASWVPSDALQSAYRVVNLCSTGSSCPSRQYSCPDSSSNNGWADSKAAGKAGSAPSGAPAKVLKATHSPTKPTTFAVRNN